MLAFDSLTNPISSGLGQCHHVQRYPISSTEYYQKNLQVKILKPNNLGAPINWKRLLFFEAKNYKIIHVMISEKIQLVEQGQHNSTSYTTLVNRSCTPIKVPSELTVLH